VLKQTFNTPQLLGDMRAGTAITNVALAIAWAHHKGRPVMVAGTTEPDKATAVMVTPPDRARVFDPEKNWFRARGEGYAYLPWWGLRKDLDWSAICRATRTDLQVIHQKGEQDEGVIRLGDPTTHGGKVISAGARVAVREKPLPASVIPAPAIKGHEVASSSRAIPRSRSMALQWLSRPSHQLWCGADFDGGRQRSRVSFSKRQTPL
jgi:hypothetical protein